MFDLDPEILTTSDIYRVQMHEMDNLEEDKEANCKNYEKERNQSFKTCVESTVEKLFIKKFVCMPPWFIDNEGNFW